MPILSLLNHTLLFKLSCHLPQPPSGGLKCRYWAIVLVGLELCSTARYLYPRHQNFKSREHEITYLTSKFSFLSIPRNHFSLCWITHSSKIEVTMYPRAVTWTFRPFIKSWTSTSLCVNQVKSGMKKEQPKHRQIPLRNHEAGARYVRGDKDVKYKEDSLRNRTSAIFQMKIAFPWKYLLALRIWKLPQWIFFSE
jgi:hypothetical protein